MTFLAPGWLLLGAAVGAALVALHLLAVGRPVPAPWPTARFVPVRAARAQRLARRPTDRLLLATRVLAVLLAAFALAGPVRAPARRSVARVIVADRSRAARDDAAVRDSVRIYATAGDLLIAFDTAAAPPVALGASAAARDSAIDGLAPDAVAAGSLSAALAAARRAAPALRAAADSIELVIVSPLTTREADAATGVVRDEWAGRARVVRVAAARSAPGGAGVRVIARRTGILDDALAATALLLGERGAGSGADCSLRSQCDRTATAVNRSAGAERPPSSPLPAPRSPRIIRDGVTAADLTWARDSGGVLLDWPAAGVPNGWTARGRPDTANAVVAGGSAFVAPMARRAALGTGGRDAGLVVARWADGEPAAVERAAGDGCVRTVAVPVPQVGDAALRPPFLALLAALTAPCAHRSPGAPLDTSAVRALAGTGALLATSVLAAPAATRDPLAVWLLAAALALLVAELPLRLVGRRRADAVDEGVDVAADTAVRARGAAA